MKIKYWLILALVATLIIVVIYYPLSFDLYENLKAKKMIDYTLIPIFILILFYSSYSAIKSKGTTIKEFIFYHLFIIGVISIFHFSIFRPLLSNGLVCINYCIGTQETIQIKGLITDKTVIKGGYRYIGKYELTVKSDKTEYIFDSNLNTLKKFEKGDLFNLKMKKGFLGLVYVKL